MCLVFFTQRVLLIYSSSSQKHLLLILTIPDLALSISMSLEFLVLLPKPFLSGYPRLEFFTWHQSFTDLSSPRSKPTCPPLLWTRKGLNMSDFTSLSFIPHLAFVFFVLFITFYAGFLFFRDPTGIKLIYFTQLYGLSWLIDLVVWFIVRCCVAIFACTIFCIVMSILPNKEYINKQNRMWISVYQCQWSWVGNWANIY